MGSGGGRTPPTTTVNFSLHTKNLETLSPAPVLQEEIRARTNILRARTVLERRNHHTPTRTLRVSDSTLFKVDCSTMYTLSRSAQMHLLETK